MALVITKTAELYRYIFEDLSDPRVESFPLMSSPVKVLGIIAVYLFFVFKWGPNFMKNRKPYDLDKIMMIYNFAQILFNIHLIIACLRYCYFKNYSLLCEPVDYSYNTDSLKIAGFVHFYFMLKVLDLLDTVFFVLRKKNNQVTFLHVYHHSGMVVLTWNAVKFLAGGHSIFTGFLNSFVHVVMYGYYFITSWNSKYKNNIWWKKYITQLQFMQFTLIMIHWIFLFFQPNCKYPKFTLGIMIPQNFFMMTLFGDFYRKTYMKKDPKIKINDKNV